MRIITLHSAGLKVIVCRERLGVLGFTLYHTMCHCSSQPIPEGLNEWKNHRKKVMQVETQLCGNTRQAEQRDTIGNVHLT